jgi:hypothetical protein
VPTNTSVYHKLNTDKRRILCWLTSCTLASNLKRIYTDNSLLKYDPLKSVQHDNWATVLGFPQWFETHLHYGGTDYICWRNFACSLGCFLCSHLALLPFWFLLRRPLLPSSPLHGLLTAPLLLLQRLTSVPLIHATSKMVGSVGCSLGCQRLGYFLANLLKRCNFCPR